MKNVFLLSLVMLFFLPLSEANAQYEGKYEGKIVIGGEFRLHKPRTDCTEGFGFCFTKATVKLEAGIKVEEKNSAYGKVEIDGPLFRFTIHKFDGMTQQTYDDNFKSGSITLDENQTLDEATLNGAGYKGLFILKKGTYPVTEQGDYVIIEIPGA